jgi:hypothetical protein
VAVGAAGLGGVSVEVGAATVKVGECAVAVGTAVKGGKSGVGGGASFDRFASVSRGGAPGDGCGENHEKSRIKANTLIIARMAPATLPIRTMTSGIFPIPTFN